MLKSKLLAVALVIALAAIGCETDDADAPAEQPEEVQQQDDQPDEFEAAEDEEAVEDEEQAQQQEDEAALEVHEPAEGIFTTAQPSGEDLEELAEQGIQVVINLREQDEDDYLDNSEKVEELGMEYISIPVNSDDGPDEEEVAQVGEALDGAEGDVLMHCGSADRAGAVLALRGYWDQEMDRDEALEFGDAAGLTDLREMVEATIDE